MEMKCAFTGLTATRSCFCLLNCYLDIRDELQYCLGGLEIINTQACLFNSATPEYKIVTTEKVDREQRAEYHLVVTCRDAGHDVTDEISSNLESSREIVVAVLDTNDNAPQFAQSEFNVSVPENAPPGTELYRLNATDADFGPNAELRYRIRALDDVGEGLSVNPTSGVVSSQISLDYESSPRELVYEVRETERVFYHNIINKISNNIEVLGQHRLPLNASIKELLNYFCNAN